MLVLPTILDAALHYFYMLLTDVFEFVRRKEENMTGGAVIEEGEKKC